MNLLLFLAHSVEEYDQVRLLSDLGHEVFSIGAYIDPASPLDDMRPALERTARNWHPELKALVDALPEEPTPDRLDNAKIHTPDAILDWADVLICHHIEHRWLWPQMARFKEHGVRVIWRTVGQSSHVNEGWASEHPSVDIVRYSPREANIPNYAGAKALVRFYKDPAEYGGWTGDDARALWLTQEPVKRRDAVNLVWLLQATLDLPVRVIGPGTDIMRGGEGRVEPAAVLDALRSARAMVYTGTQPASYTLALIEAMMTGAPVVSIGAERMDALPYGPGMFEGDTIAPLASANSHFARGMLSALLADRDYAAEIGEASREKAIGLFGRQRALDDWQAVLEERWGDITEAMP